MIQPIIIIDIARLICKVLDGKCPRSDGKSYADQIAFVKDRPGHVLRYAIDASKIETELGWKAKESFESGMEKTMDWYSDQTGAGIQARDR